MASKFDGMGVLNAFIPFLPYLAIGGLIWIYKDTLMGYMCKLPLNPFGCTDAGDSGYTPQPIGNSCDYWGRWNCIQSGLQWNETLCACSGVTPGTGYEVLPTTWQDYLDSGCSLFQFDWNTGECVGFGGGGAGGR